MHTEITNLTDMTTGTKYNVKTKCTIEFVCKITHRLIVIKLKKYIKFTNKWRVK